MLLHSSDYLSQIETSPMCTINTEIMINSAITLSNLEIVYLLVAHHLSLCIYIT